MKTMCPPGYHHNGFILPHLASVRFEHSVCRGSLVTTNITLLALLVEDIEEQKVGPLAKPTGVL